MSDQEFADEQFDSDLEDDWEAELDNDEEDERKKREEEEKKAKEKEKFKPKQALSREAAAKALAEAQEAQGVDLTDDAARAEAELQQKALEAKNLAGALGDDVDDGPSLASAMLKTEKEYLDWTTKVLAQVQQHRGNPNYERIFANMFKATGGLMSLEALERMKAGITTARAAQKAEADRLRLLKKEQQAAKEKAQGKKGAGGAGAAEKSSFDRNVATMEGYGDDNADTAEAKATRNVDDMDFM